MSTYTPQVGDVIKMRSWHGIVLDIFRSDANKTVLQVQTVRNIFRKLGPELIEVDLAPEHIAPATLEDLHREIALHREMQENALQQFISQAAESSTLSVSEKVLEV
ncbi:MAG: hypothetical protein DPW09_15175 [Anaerolineae bacterium]|nr:hypothetical protein [Anaerolineales bacterium]MCQ3974782.1 hypothetical protein [Anaerolineae bacterium]